MRKLNRLSATRVATVKIPGKYADGGGLYLQVGPTLTKSWLFRFERGSEQHWMGLGPLFDVSLADARIAAGECRASLRKGIDPLADRGRQRTAQRLIDASTVTFADCCAQYIAATAPAWRNEKHVAQWRSTLATYAEPILGKLAVQDVNTALVVKVLQPIWYSKTETATRVRQRIESVLDWATASGYRTGENPARLKGNIADLLPAATKLKAVKHHPALPFADINAFVTELRAQVGVAARAFEFTILTAARTNETIGARWDEFDLKAATWTIPGSRMKAGRDHTVPLSPRAVAILTEMAEHGVEYVFPGQSAGGSLSNMAMLEVLRRMNRTDLTVHGFRSTFSDWAHESTGYANHIIEMALAHSIKDKAEKAYRRGDLLKKRRALMNDWAKFIELKPGTAAVTRIRGRG